MLELPDPDDFTDDRSGVAVLDEPRSTPPQLPSPYTPEHRDAAAQALGFENAAQRDEIAAAAGQPAKRKRRTKAEMEAARNTETSAAEDQAVALGVVPAPEYVEEPLPDFDVPNFSNLRPATDNGSLGNQVGAVEDGMVELIASLRHELIQNTKALDALRAEMVEMRAAPKG